MGKTILTVDDSASIRQMIAMTLEASGYQVIQAVDGVDGYDKATASRPDAVITDLNMPNMSGLDFLRKYRTHPSSMGVPVLLLTTESDDTLKQQAKAAGATGWIVKPFRQEQLVAIVNKVTGR